MLDNTSEIHVTLKLNLVSSSVTPMLILHYTLWTHLYFMHVVHSCSWVLCSPYQSISTLVLLNHWLWYGKLSLYIKIILCYILKMVELSFYAVVRTNVRVLFAILRATNFYIRGVRVKWRTWVGMEDWAGLSLILQ